MVYRWRHESDQTIDESRQDEEHEFRASIADAMAQLSSRQHQIALAYYVEEPTLNQITASVRLFEGAVKYHLFEARKKLAKVLGDMKEMNNE